MAYDTIWKFQLDVKDEQLIQIPAGADILSVHCQHDVPTLWAKVDSNAPKKFRKVYIRGTGRGVIGEEGVFVDTCLMAHGTLVWHVFIGPEAGS